MLAGLWEGAQLLANVRQVVTRVRVAGIEAHGLAQILARIFELAEIVEHAAQIEVR